MKDSLPSSLPPSCMPQSGPQWDGTWSSQTQGCYGNKPCPLDGSGLPEIGQVSVLQRPEALLCWSHDVPSSELLLQQECRLSPWQLRAGPRSFTDIAGVIQTKAIWFNSKFNFCVIIINSLPTTTLLVLFISNPGFPQSRSHLVSVLSNFLCSRETPHSHRPWEDSHTL